MITSVKALKQDLADENATMTERYSINDSETDTKVKGPWRFEIKKVQCNTQAAIRKRRSKSKRLACSFTGCSCSFKYQKALEKHVSQHFYCKKSLNNYFGFWSNDKVNVESKHKLKKQKKMKYQCPECTKNFFKRTSMARHIKLHNKKIVFTITKSEDTKKKQLPIDDYSACTTNSESNSLKVVDDSYFSLEQNLRTLVSFYQDNTSGIYSNFQEFHKAGVFSFLK